MKGLSSLLSHLSRLPGQGKNALSRAAMEAAEETVFLAKGAAPVKTGALRRSIDIRPAEEGWEAYTDCPYAGAVEKGNGRMKAQPFLAPSVFPGDFFARAARAIREKIK